MKSRFASIVLLLAAACQSPTKPAADICPRLTNIIVWPALPGEQARITYLYQYRSGEAFGSESIIDCK